MKNNKDYLQNDTNSEFINSLKDENLKNILSDSLELTLDNFLEDGLLKEVPVVGSIINIGKFVYTVKNKFTAKKILKFLLEIKNVSKGDREKFLKDLEDNDKFKQSASDTLLSCLDRLDHLHKATILGRLLVAYVQQKISIEEYSRYSFIIEKVYLNDLNHLNKFSIDEGIQYDTIISESLSQVGLIKLASISGLTWEGGMTTELNYYALTLLGKKLFDLNILDFIKVDKNL